jgi:Tol biopolymer transport system component
MWLERLALDTGDEPETLIEGEAQMVAVAPDGMSLLFCHQPAPAQWDISRLSLEGEKKIEPFLDTEESELFPAFSPDGRIVAYTSREAGRSQVFIRPSSGSGPKVPVPLAWSVGPTWRKAGLFVTGEKDDEAGVFQIDVATEPRLSIEAVRFLFAVPENVGVFDVAPDGQRLLMIEMEPRELEPPPLAVIPNWLDEMRARLEEGGR